MSKFEPWIATAIIGAVIALELRLLIPKIPQLLSWMTAHREYASLGMVISAHGFYFVLSWCLWRHFALAWTWHESFFGKIN